jgi:methionyl-tRNA formyltransferase
MRLVFIGSGDIGLPSLEALLTSREHELVAVVTQPDKPVGRSQVLTPSRIKASALAAGVPVLQPEKIRNAVEELSALNADVFVVVAYGQILPRQILQIPHKACLNIHASLLPRHRGASPIQAAIREGDAETGITIMWMDEGLDTGDVLLMERTAITTADTGGILHDRLAEMAPDALRRALEMIASDKAPRVPQDHATATVTRKLEREHGRIDWNQSAEKIAALVRAYDPWPGTFCFLSVGDGKKLHLKIWRASAVATAEACPVGGTIIRADEKLLVSCGSGVIELSEVQLEGRKRMSALDFLRGHSLKPGDRLE